jgi:proline iminopeptidase/L-proline amide hydrolase
MLRLTLAALALMFAVPINAQSAGPEAEAEADAELPATPAAFAKPDRTLMVPVEGGTVWVRVNGDLEAEAAPVVFIHGGPGGTHVGFAGLLTLADTRAVILYDQLDSGKSERPGDPANWRPERFVLELEAIRAALNIERWHVVGHSWGSALALEYSAAYPQHTASTVLSGTYISTPRWAADTQALIDTLAPSTQQVLRACMSDKPPAAALCTSGEAAYENAFLGRPDAPPPGPLVSAYARAYGGQGRNPVVYNTMWGPSEFEPRGTLIDYDITDLLGRIDGNRTLFLVGQYDEARIDTVQDFVARTPGAELGVVPGGSHSFLRERPAISEAMLRSWLSRKDPRIVGVSAPVPPRIESEQSLSTPDPSEGERRLRKHSKIRDSSR